MKLILALFVLFYSITISAQRDFEQFSFTSIIKPLPTVETLRVLNFNSNKPFISTPSLPNFKNRDNTYWQPVDMVIATTQKKNDADYIYKIPTLTNYTLQKDDYVSDGKTRVVNSVQKNSYGLNILDPCPPGGICPKCAPYRQNRNF